MKILIFLALFLHYVKCNTVDSIKIYDKSVLPNAMEFYEDYILSNQSVIFKQGMYTMDLHNLKVDNLQNSGLAFLTFVDVSCQDSNYRENLNSFLRKMKESGCSINTSLANNLKRFVKIPRILICSHFVNGFESTNHIIKKHNQQTRIKVHEPSRDILWCLIDGSATVSIQRENEEIIKEEVDLIRGDCLFIPRNMIVNKIIDGLENSLELRLKREELLEPDVDCMKNMDNKSPFSTLSFTGDGSKGIELSLDKDRKVLEKCMKIFSWVHKSSLTSQDLFGQLKRDGDVIKDLKIWNEECTARGNEMFTLLDTNKDDRLDTHDFDQLSENEIIKLQGYLQDRLADLQDIASDQRFSKYPAQIKNTNSKDEL